MLTLLLSKKRTIIIQHHKRILKKIEGTALYWLIISNKKNEKALIYST